MFYKGTIKGFSNILGVQACSSWKGTLSNMGQFPSPQQDEKEHTETRPLCWSRSQAVASEERSVRHVATQEAYAGKGGGEQQAGTPLQISSAVQEGQTDVSSQREIAVGYTQPLS